MDLFILITFLITGIIGASMADNRNRSTLGGFILGGVLGLIGLAIIALMGKHPYSDEERR